MPEGPEREELACEELARDELATVSSVSSTPDTLANPDWVVTMFSFTTELVTGDRTPNQLVSDVLDAGLTHKVELDAPQHFASYPTFDEKEVAALRSIVDGRGLQLSMLGIYNDSILTPGRPASTAESVEYVGRQIRLAGQLGFAATRIAFGVDEDLLTGLVPIAEEVGVPVLQEVQGSATPDAPEFDRQRELIGRIGSDKLGFVFDLSACMLALPITYLAELRRAGIPDAVVTYLAEAWPAEPTAVVKNRVEAMLAGVAVTPSARVRLMMPFGRFGKSRVADWRDSLGEFSAIHLKYWDLEDDDHRVSGPIADVRREFGAIGYAGSVTSEWGGHEWFELDQANGFDMTWGHRKLYDAAISGT